MKIEENTSRHSRGHSTCNSLQFINNDVTLWACLVCFHSNYKLINTTMATMKEPQHNKIEPTKCSLRYKPPVLIIFYNDLITGEYR